ncbi:amidohydrolase family protein [Candidatus Bathyarchaeota archaeon]|nr:amidohydrolase family protein [Candidatus Bathyarchaeota archaeon]
MKEIEKTKAIRNCTLIDGTGRDPVQGITVLIEGSKILEVVKGETSIPQGSLTIDAKGRTVMPGMIDAHVHLASWTDPTEPNLMVSMMSTHPNLLTLYAAKHAQEMLEAGFTTVRDLAGYMNQINHEVLAVKRAIEIGMARGPRVLVAGLVTQTAGHLDMKLPPTFHQENRGVADGPWEVRKMVRKMWRWGHDLIKTSSSGGIAGLREEVNWNNYTVDELKAIAEEAHSAGRKVACHAYGAQAVKNAAIAGVDTIEHGTQLDEEAIQLMKSKGVVWVPTLMVTSEMALTDIKAGGASEHLLSKARAVAAVKGSNFQKAYRAGVKIAIGSDTYTMLRWHWGKQAQELQLMADLGMSNMECIVASTRTASEALGIQSETGTIEKGKEADILLVDGNPLRDIKILQDTRKILMIMKGGNIEVDRGTKE